MNCEIIEKIPLFSQSDAVVKEIQPKGEFLVL